MMASYHCLLLLVAIVYRAHSFSQYEEAEVRQQENLEILGRAVDTYRVTQYVPGLTNKTIRDCDRSLRNVYTVQFAALRTRINNEDKEYYGHIVDSEGSPCFATATQTLTMNNIKTCLIHAANNSAPSFSYDQTTKECALYDSWREHKFRQCKRGSGEKMYYLQPNPPPGFAPCSEATMALSAAYTDGGSVTVTARFNNAPCICDVDRIEYRFLQNTRAMTIPDYTYTYDLSNEAGNWRNTTVVRAFADGNLVAENTNYIPDDDL